MWPHPRQNINSVSSSYTNFGAVIYAGFVSETSKNINGSSVFLHLFSLVWERKRSSTSPFELLSRQNCTNCGAERGIVKKTQTTYGIQILASIALMAKK